MASTVILKTYTWQSLITGTTYGTIDDNLTYTYDALRPERLTQVADDADIGKGVRC